jgi:hypothetical protein
MSRKVGEGQRLYCERSTKVDEGGMPSKNKVVDEKATESSERSSVVEEGEKKPN